MFEVRRVGVGGGMISSGIHIRKVFYTKKSFRRKRF